jgi:hypothetical protein
MPGERGLATLGCEILRSEICSCGAARPNCHTLTLSLGPPGNAPTASMPALARPTAFCTPGICELEYWRFFLTDFWGEALLIFG